MKRDSFSDALLAESTEAVPSESAMPASPCIRVCTLDDDKVCRGCRRTVEEIVAWPRMSAAERARLLTELERRRS